MDYFPDRIHKIYNKIPYVSGGFSQFTHSWIVARLGLRYLYNLYKPFGFLGFSAYFEVQKAEGGAVISPATVAGGWRLAHGG